MTGEKTPAEDRNDDRAGGTRTWLITGATGGLGLSLTRAALHAGDRVIATAREPGPLQLLAVENPGRMDVVQLDVTDPQSARERLDPVLRRSEGPLILVNNAGYAQPGILEELTDDELRRQFETNFFGAVTMLRIVLPHLRAAGAGMVFTISSIAGQIGAPGMSAYTSSKHALEGLSVSLAAELRPFGIPVVIVEPGSTRTGFRNRWTQRVRSDDLIGDYDDVRAGALTGDHTQPQSSTPDGVAAAIVAAAALASPPLRLPLGRQAWETIRSARAAQLDDLDRHHRLSLTADQ
jgi:NAD(P)-dependent dehydrogenase (short-subunit alcohol dehydrogenase family)